MAKNQDKRTTRASRPSIARAWTTRTDDESLLRLWREEDDASARDELIERLARQTRRYLRNQVHSNDIDDVIQDLRMRLLTALPRYRLECPFGAYVKIIQRYCVADHLRKTGRRLRLVNDKVEAKADSTDSGAVTASCKVSLHEHFIRLWEALESDLLSEDERTIAILVLIQGLRAVDVARELELDHRAVINKVSAIRSKLKRYFAEHYMEIAKSEDEQLEQLDLDLARLGHELGLRV